MTTFGRDRGDPWVRGIRPGTDRFRQEKGPIRVGWSNAQSERLLHPARVVFQGSHQIPYKHISNSLGTEGKTTASSSTARIQHDPSQSRLATRSTGSRMKSQITSDMDLRSIGRESGMCAWVGGDNT
ncbi:hypothetical protein BKA56DRAFT_609094 [Ilyonectria sp. MPI-CAGE-AT-0026]|nr:hypothetical protein BKA56DRAFT_609094 [Ilyonectria sp. MPI-CAGE-AT-0026]